MRFKTTENVFLFINIGVRYLVSLIYMSDPNIQYYVLVTARFSLKNKSSVILPVSLLKVIQQLVIHITAIDIVDYVPFHKRLFYLFALD